jgi:hypothetical protein
MQRPTQTIKQIAYDYTFGPGRYLFALLEEEALQTIH